jgi:hypothetical protein
MNDDALNIKPERHYERLERTIAGFQYFVFSWNSLSNMTVLGRTSMQEQANG